MTQVFEALPCIDGYEVIEVRTGRPVTGRKATRQEANGIAQSMNRAILTSEQGLHQPSKAESAARSHLKKPGRKVTPTKRAA